MIVQMMGFTSYHLKSYYLKVSLFDCNFCKKFKIKGIINCKILLYTTCCMLHVSVLVTLENFVICVFFFSLVK